MSEIALPPRDDCTIDQNWSDYTPDEHETWRLLFRRQAETLRDRACGEVMEGMSHLGLIAEGIPNFALLNEALWRATRWQIVAVPGLVPDAIFFEHLANRRFPSTCFIRRRDQLDYLQEPDIFHDVYGHAPLLVNPVFADYMQAYGEGGLKALRLHALHRLSRLYWYTVEFGLIRTAAGLRIYGAGIASSRTESRYALEDPAPNRLGFDLRRVMRTRYRIDDVQETYFVIDGFDRLFAATQPDFTAIYADVEGMPDLLPGAVEAGDHVLHRGTGLPPKENGPHRNAARV